MFSGALVLLAACSGRDGSGAENGRISFGRFDPKLHEFRIWTSEPDGTDPRPLVPQMSWVSDWSPDGRRLVFEDLASLKTVAPDGSDSRVLVDSLGWQAIPKWSQTDEWITFEGSQEKPADPLNGSPDFRRSVWVIRPDGTDLHRVTDEFDLEPFFSPDGSQIAFNHVVKPGSSATALKSIEVTDFDGGGRREIVPATAGLEHGDWSPDGEWIVYDIETLGSEPDQPPGRGAIWAVHPDGSDRHILVPPNDQWYAFVKPAWSPDGKKILAGCNTPGGVDRICVIDVKTGDVTLVIDHSNARQPVNFPAWGPAADPAAR
jgi:Tol biopolymer transport system component